MILRYVPGRVAQALLVLWAAFTMAFVLLQALPGDAVLIRFQSPEMGLSAAQIAELQALPSLFIPVPTFWLGIVLIQVVSSRLRLVPVINPGEWEGLILPVCTLAIPISAPLAQILIRSIDAVQTQNFVAVARAKGASRRRVPWRHVADDAVLPVPTIAGLLLGEQLAGAVVTETVFGLSGLGSLTRDAVASQDTSVLMAIVVLSAAVFVAINLVVDLLDDFGHRLGAASRPAGGLRPGRRGVPGAVQRLYQGADRGHPRRPGDGQGPCRFRGCGKMTIHCTGQRLPRWKVSPR